jgi:ParB family chromosome partitioning protein
MVADGPAGLEDLISSIAVHGVLQPILVEQTLDGPLVVICGERRLRAAQWVAANGLGGSRSAGSIPAVVRLGPLSVSDRRLWQLTENLARVDLTPTELGRALWFARVAVLADRLTEVGLIPPSEVLELDDPVTAFEHLDRFRLTAGGHQVGAPWPSVIEELGINLPAGRVEQVAKAFQAIPADVAGRLDAAGVSIACRSAWAKLAGRHTPAAMAVLDEVEHRDEPALLPGAVAAASAALDRRQDFHELDEHDPGFDPEELVDSVQAVHDAANEARRTAASGPPTEIMQPAPAPVIHDEGDDPPEVDITPVSAELTRLITEMRAGRQLSQDQVTRLRPLLVRALSLLSSPVDVGTRPTGR